MSMPAQKPHKSKQTYGTPWPLIRAVEKKWGAIAVDLAASKENTKAPVYITEGQNSLSVAWHRLAEPNQLLWLNPPFKLIRPWAKKCFEESLKGAFIAMLTPASVSSEWFTDYCFEQPRICKVFLRPRVVFEDEKDPYPKDLMLTLWTNGMDNYIILKEYDSWRWDEEFVDA